VAVKILESLWDTAVCGNQTDQSPSGKRCLFGILVYPGTFGLGEGRQNPRLYIYISIPLGYLCSVGDTDIYSGYLYPLGIDILSSETWYSSRIPIFFGNTCGCLVYLWLFGILVSLWDTGVSLGYCYAFWIFIFFWGIYIRFGGLCLFGILVCILELGE